MLGSYAPMQQYNILSAETYATRRAGECYSHSTSCAWGIPCSASKCSGSISQRNASVCAKKEGGFSRSCVPRLRWPSRAASPKITGSDLSSQTPWSSSRSIASSSAMRGFDVVTGCKLTSSWCISHGKAVSSGAASSCRRLEERSSPLGRRRDQKLSGFSELLVIRPRAQSRWGRVEGE